MLFCFYIEVQNQNMHPYQKLNENEAKFICIFNVPERSRFNFIQFRLVQLI